MITLPGKSDRTVVIGATGSGKTVFGIYLLSLMNWDEMPWIIVDGKGDELIARLPGTRLISLGDKIPTEPGIYIVRPGPHDTQEYDEFLWRCWSAENVGLYIDEGFLLPTRTDKGIYKPAFDAIQVQGRSKNIPTIVLTQRPSWISRFAFSEASFFIVFGLTTQSDRKRVEEFVPFSMTAEDEPKRFHSRYFSVKEKKWFHLRPVEPENVTLARYSAKLEKMLDNRKSGGIGIRWI